MLKKERFFGFLHLVFGGEIDPELEACVGTRARRHLGVDDSSPGGHPLWAL